MPLGKLIIIADDAVVNRKMLVKLLSSEYTPIEAENGRDALELLHQYGTAVSGVILDLVMPVLDGFGFLRAIQGVEEYKNIPIIVATGNGGDESEMDALKLGAWDFITKPYNGEIIKFRLRNAIDRSQLSAFKQLKYLAEYDTLTGIYNKSKFFEMTRAMLDANPDKKFAFIRLDIDRFQLINSFFGIEEGDRLLCYLASSLKTNYTGELYAFGRMEADVFASCFAYESRDDVRSYLASSKERVKAYNRSFDIVPIYGVYFLDDTSLPVSEMLDRATLAAKTCKGNYLDTTAIYENEMTRKLEKEQEIINEMTTELNEKQFCVYLQPKYSLNSNLPDGAEALVRWKHPQKGIIPPGEFMPVFEKNGFVSKLDYNVWEMVCSLLNDWIEKGITPSPISVNVSRVNLYNPNIAELIGGLVKKYGVPPSLLQLELTESAYMDNPQVMEKAVEQLHAAGFTILMDDFGSGYSSLSVLKNVEVDVLKIDMRFFEKTRISGRGESIIASIIRMAKWLSIPVTAEGVETREQIDFLRSVGCDDVQGFYYAKPMPAEEYLTFVRQQKAADVNYAERYDGLNPDKLWSLEPEILLLFSDDPSPRAIYEYNEGNIEVLRVNKAFKDMLGFGLSPADIAPLNHILQEYHETVLGAFEACAENLAMEQCEYRRRTADGSVLWIRLTLQYAQRVGLKYILMGHMENITELKAMERRYISAVSGISHLGFEGAGAGKSITEIIEETQRKIYTDALTGAYNRRLLSELLFIKTGSRGGCSELGIVLLDLRGFKQINDRFGHEAGDKLLAATAEKLRVTVRQNDSVIRYGGDEFVVTLTDCAEAQVKNAISRMQDALGSISINGTDKCKVSADFGYAYSQNFSGSYEEVESMLREADAAMYKAKNSALT